MSLVERFCKYLRRLIKPNRVAPADVDEDDFIFIGGCPEDTGEDEYYNEADADDADDQAGADSDADDEATDEEDNVAPVIQPCHLPYDNDCEDAFDSSFFYNGALVENTDADFEDPDAGNYCMPYEDVWTDWFALDFMQQFSRVKKLYMKFVLYKLASSVGLQKKLEDIEQEAATLTTLQLRVLHDEAMQNSFVVLKNRCMLCGGYSSFCDECALTVMVEDVYRRMLHSNV
jgi:hypothetical protein